MRRLHPLRLHSPRRDEYAQRTFVFRNRVEHWEFVDEIPKPQYFNGGGDMNSTHNPGRVAGFWYLLLVLIGPLRLIYIPTKLFVHGNAAATVNNIAAHEWLFRFGIVSDLAGGVILIFLVLAF
jgi:hypothetical protein